jgi:hypothetical protein
MSPLREGPVGLIMIRRLRSARSPTSRSRSQDLADQAVIAIECAALQRDEGSAPADGDGEI